MNILLIIVGIITIFNFISGFKKGMVKQIISLISLILASVVIVMIGIGLQSYLEGEFVTVVVLLILLSVLATVHHLLNLVFFSAKVLSKLPILNIANKLAGAVVGVIETLVLLWIVYTLAEIMPLGEIGLKLQEYTESSHVLLWIHQHNYISELIKKFGIELSLTL